MEKNDIKTSQKSLGLFDLIGIGIGAIIGTGILVLTGIVAAQDAGPAVVLSFIIAALASGLIGLCYAELTTSLPNSGSAFYYTWVSLGSFFAFLAGWTLIGVYVTTTATVANGWTGYFGSFLSELHINLPHNLMATPDSGGLMNLPAVIMVLLISFILTRGTSESKLVNNTLVAVKLVIIMLFLIVSVRDINVANFHPFMPYGISGVFTGASTVFFSFLGFDALATSAEDAKNVNRNLPLAIVISLSVSTLLYVLVGIFMTGVLHYKKLDVSEAMSTVLLSEGHVLVAQIVSFGAVLGIMAVVFAFIYAGSNIIKSMSRSQFLPAGLSKINQKTYSPNRAIWLVGILSAVLAGEFNLHYLALISNVGSLVVFLVISGIVIIMRKRYPLLKRPFLVPGGAVVPTLSVLICAFLLFNISVDAWLTYLAWLVIGVIVYLLYGRNHLDVEESQNQKF
ncbi:MAG: amino acid permease [Limosilactobacillus sp.]|uniref:APC family permease n=1 Tax=Limosilactobacillus sp. TaxID=2773925 RepID=UPI0027035ED7|nr:amino acid permease [Limosilactobacillus sp.]